MAESKPSKFPWPEATSTSESYTGSCHCGAIRFEFTISPPLYASQTSSSSDDNAQYPVIRCNCSICTKNGYLFVYPYKEDVKFLDDSEAKFKTYSMGSKKCPHNFCPDCGSSIGTDLGALGEMTGEDPRFGMNVRMIKDIDLGKLKYRDVSRADSPPAYKSPV